MDQEQFFKMQNSGLFVFFDRILQLAYVNVLMILFSLLGLFVFGFYPAAFAAAGIFNQTFEAKDGNTFRRFFEYYKKSFLIGNLCMVYTSVCTAAGYYLIFRMPLDRMDIIQIILFFLWLCASLIGMLWNCYLPSVHAMYSGFSLKKKLLFSLAAGLTKWKLTLCLILIFCVGIAIILVFPSIMLFMAVSIIPFLFTLLVKRTLLPNTMKHGDEVEENKKESDQLQS